MTAPGVKLFYMCPSGHHERRDPPRRESAAVRCGHCGELMGEITIPAAGPGDVEQALELRSRIRYAIEQGDGSVTGERIRMDTAETTLHFRWMGHDYVLTITDQTPEGT